MRLQGRTAIITGSTKGIGAAMAARFAAEGANVVVCGRNDSAGTKVAEEIQGNGGAATFVHADVSQESDVEALVKAAVGTFGGLDILVNNAAATDAIVERAADKPAAQIATDDFDYILKVGLYGPYYTIKHSVPVMSNREGGAAIINISSGASLLGVGGIFAYTCTKGALNALTKQVAVDYGSVGIRCNTIVVGVVMNEEWQQGVLAHPIAGPAYQESSLHGRMGSPEDIAALAAYLCSAEGAFINGVCIPADGGLTAKLNLPDMSVVFGDVAVAAQ